MRDKKWYKSRVLWLNFFLGIGAALEASFSVVQGYFDPRMYLGLVSLVAGANMVLRFVSTSRLVK